MTQGTQKTDDRTDSRNGEILGTTSYNRLNGKAWLTAVVLLWANNTRVTPLMSIDLIGEKNQVILLEYCIFD